MPLEAKASRHRGRAHRALREQRYILHGFHWQRWSRGFESGWDRQKTQVGVHDGSPKKVDGFAKLKLGGPSRHKK
eukprot:2776832-Prymnesium_polylepis.1